MKKRCVIWVLVVSLIIGLFAPFGGGDGVEAASAKLNKTKITLQVGQDTTLKVKNSQKKVTWASSNQKVATVSAKGVVKAKKKGKTKITAKVGGKKLICRVTVKAKTGLNYTAAALEPKETLKLKVTGAKKVRWTSSNKKIASVSAKGKVTAKKAGKVTIKARSGKKTWKCKITVGKRRLSSTSIVLEVGKTKKLSLKNSFGTVKWSSSASSVVSVSSKGLLKAKKAGKAKIYAKCCGKKYVCSVTVKNSAEKKIQISFTGDGVVQRTAADDGKTYASLETKEESVVAEGKITCKDVKLASVSYELTDNKDEKIAGGALGVSAIFKVKVSPVVGTNTFTVTATATDGTVVSESLTIVRYSDEVTVNENVCTLSEEETENFAESIENIDYEEKEETINGTTLTVNYIKVTLDSDAELVENLKDGTIKKGDVVYVQDEDLFPSGFSGIVVSYEETTDEDGTVKTEVTFKEAGFSDIFSGDGCLKIDEIDTEDPVAFMLFPGDSSTVSAAAVGDTSAVSAIAEGNSGTSSSSSSYTTSYFPEGISGSLTPKVSVSGGKLSVEMNFDDIIVYDGDKDKETDDQIVLEGSLGLEDIAAEFTMEWEDALPSQIRFDKSFTKNVDVKLKTSGDLATIDLGEIIKKGNGEFKNQCDLMGIKVSGIDMSNRFLIGMIGIHVTQKVDVVKDGELGQYAKMNIDPVLCVGIYLDVDGGISGSVSIGLESTAYTEEGVNFYNDNYPKVKYNGSAKADTTVNLGFGYKYETYSNKRKAKNDYTDPSPEIVLNGTAEAKAEVGAGAMAGVMLLGIIPADVYAGAYAGMEASLEGELRIRVGDKDDDLQRLYPNVRLKGKEEAGLRIGYDLKVVLKSILPGIKKLSIGTSDKKDFPFIKYEFNIPSYRLYGKTEALKELGKTDKETVGGAEIALYQKDKLGSTEEYTQEFLSKYESDFEGKSGTDGSYDIKGMDRTDYIVLVTLDGYEPYIEEIGFTEDVEKLLCLTPMREVNWLDVCAPIKYTGYSGQTYMGDGTGEMTISGVTYDVGFYMSGGNAGSGSTRSYWQLDRKFSKLKVRIGHVDSSAALTATLKVYLDGSEEASQEIPLSELDASEVYTINLNYADTAILKMERGTTSNWSHAEYGFVEGVWYGTEGAQGTVHMKDPFEDADWDADFMTLCPPFFTRSYTQYQGDVSVGGEIYTSGFALNTSGGYGNGSKSGYAVFNTSGEFSTFEVTVGLAGDSSRTYGTTLHVYLNGEDDSSMDVELDSDTVQTLTIPLEKAEYVRLSVDSAADSMNGAGANYAFVNGKWVK